MKKKILFIFVSLIILRTSSQTPNSWSQKANSGGTPKSQATAFVVNGKAYYVTGYQFTNELWEYNPATNAWSQKANYPGPALIGAISFSIGDNGYVLLGNDAGMNGYAAVWEYNPKANSWTQKAYFPGNTSNSECGFSIGKNGYVVVFNSGKNETWKYNSDKDTWLQKSNFPGTYRNEGAFGLSNGDKGYVGFGTQNNTTFYNDFWEYDTLANSWTQKSNFGGANIANPSGFALGGKIYVGTGRTSGFASGFKSDFYEYNPSDNTWTQIANFPSATAYSSGFSIGNKGYIVGGILNSTSSDALWEYTPLTSYTKTIKNENQIISFPNPFNNLVYLTNLPKSDITQICIYDMVGKKILTQTSDQCNISIELPNTLLVGVYLIEIKQANNIIYSQKIIKQTF